MKTRQDYMNGDCTQREYYAQFVTSLTKAAVLREIGIDKLKKSTDRAFNDIPLELWYRLQFNIPDMKPHGDYVSDAGKVCIAKEAARQRVDRAGKGVAELCC